MYSPNAGKERAAALIRTQVSAQATLRRRLQQGFETSGKSTCFLCTLFLAPG